MQYTPDTASNQIKPPPFEKPALQYFIVFFMLITAFGIRLYHIKSPPMDFASIRQYQNAHIARGIYFDKNESITGQRKEIAKLNMQRMGLVLEPRIIENAAVLGYRIAGAEHLWIPRVLSSIFWITGGLLLYLIARDLSSFGAALFSTVFYLFLPYSIPASRSFQPDPLMVMMFLASIYTILLYFKNPSIFRLLVSSIIASAAIVIKPYCLFPIWLVFIFISIHDRGFRKTILGIPAPAFIFMSFIPSFFQYVYGLFTNAGFLQQHAHGSFLPHLILSLSFWKGWLLMIGSVTGYPAFILAAAGFISARKGLHRTLLTGLWLGYLFFGLSATYQMHTHSYYHMPLIPIAGLSLGPIGAGATCYVTKVLRNRWRLSVIILVLIIISTVGIRQQLKNPFSDYENELKFAAKVMGINPEFKEFLTGNYEKELKTAKEIGEHVKHSTNTIFLTPAFGRVLAYYGEFSGLPWPTSNSLYARKARGTRPPNVKEDFTPQHIIIGYQGKFIKYTPDFFIITDLEEFEKQSDLREHLKNNFPVLVKSNEYIIFDLRNMAKILE